MILQYFALFFFFFFHGFPVFEKKHLDCQIFGKVLTILSDMRRSWEGQSCLGWSPLVSHSLSVTAKLFRNKLEVCWTALGHIVLHNVALAAYLKGANGSKYVKDFSVPPSCDRYDMLRRNCAHFSRLASVHKVQVLEHIWTYLKYSMVQPGTWHGLIWYMHK